MRDYAEKRDFIRMGAECPMTFRTPESDQAYEAKTKNLSGNGVQFETKQEPVPGSLLEITITPGLSTTPPLRAQVEVIRVTSSDSGDRYVVAARITEIRL